MKVNCLKEYIQKRMLNYGDAPEYEKNINILMSYSAGQTYIQERKTQIHGQSIGQLG